VRNFILNVAIFITELAKFSNDFFFMHFCLELKSVIENLPDPRMSKKMKQLQIPCSAEVFFLVQIGMDTVHL
jgi:hypothetical protein